MTETKEISLSQALVYQKRLAQELNKVNNKIRTENCKLKFKETLASGTVKTSTPERAHDVETLLERRDTIKNEIMNLKISNWETSKPIRRKILQIAELKDDASFFSSIDARHGKVREPYGEGYEEYDSFMKEDHIENKLKEITQKIDQLQDDINSFNYTTKIVVNDIGV